MSTIEIIHADKLMEDAKGFYVHLSPIALMRSLSLSRPLDYKYVVETGLFMETLLYEGKKSKESFSRVFRYLSTF